MRHGRTWEWSGGDGRHAGSERSRVGPVVGVFCIAKI
jgi:hypothetical protein